LAIRFSTDAVDVDLDWLHEALSRRAYWALGRSREVVERSVANSLCFSAFVGGRQVAFARVVTDQATFAWVCDVFVDEEMRGAGIGSQLMAVVSLDPRLAGLKRIVLVTSSPDFYRRFGFEPLDRPDRWMLRRGPGPAD
jgi:N-acetylglutamate synthase-like GNAT family acetyltransferase